MYPKIVKALQKNSLWLSLLLHIFIFLCFFSTFNRHSQIEPKPNLYVPAYLYESKNNYSVNKPQHTLLNKTSVMGLQSKPKNHSALETPLISHASSHQVTTDPIHLIGDKQTTPKPLIKLLAKALTRTLVYPKSAVDFQLKGIAYIKFLLHPDGTITEVTLIQSSSVGVLDRAALESVYAISPLPGVKQYLFTPEYITFGFIFGS